MQLRCSSLSITAPMSFLADEFDVRSVLHGSMSLAAVNEIYAIHEVVNGCKNLTMNYHRYCYRSVVCNKISISTENALMEPLKSTTKEYVILHRFHQQDLV